MSCGAEAGQEIKLDGEGFDEVLDVRQGNKAYLESLAGTFGLTQIMKQEQNKGHLKYE